MGPEPCKNKTRSGAPRRCPPGLVGGFGRRGRSARSAAGESGQGVPAIGARAENQEIDEIVTFASHANAARTAIRHAGRRLLNSWFPRRNQLPPALRGVVARRAAPLAGLVGLFLLLPGSPPLSFL